MAFLARSQSPPRSRGFRCLHGGSEISLLDERDESVRHASYATRGNASGFTSRLRGEGTLARRAWRSAYVRRIAGGDVLSALVAGAVGYVVRFGATGASEPHVSLWVAL